MASKLIILWSHDNSFQYYGISSVCRHGMIISLSKGNQFLFQHLSFRHKENKSANKTVVLKSKQSFEWNFNNIFARYNTLACQTNQPLNYDENL